MARRCVNSAFLCLEKIVKNRNETLILRYQGEWVFSVEKSLIMFNIISAQARFLYIVLKSFVGPNSSCPFPSMKLLCEIMGMADKPKHEETTRKYLRELIDSGLISRHQLNSNGTFGRVEYVLYNPAETIENHKNRVEQEEKAGDSPKSEKHCAKNTAHGKIPDTEKYRTRKNSDPKKEPSLKDPLNKEPEKNSANAEGRQNRPVPQPPKQKSPKKETNSLHRPMVGALAELCCLDISMEKNAKRLGKVASELLKSDQEYTPNDIEVMKKWLASPKQAWRDGHITPSQVVELILVARNWNKNGGGKKSNETESARQYEYVPCPV